MPTSPSYVSQRCQKPQIPPIKMDNITSTPCSPSQNTIDVLKDRLKIKPLAKVSSNGFLQSGLKSMDTSYQTIRKTAPLVVEDMDVSQDSAIFEKIQSIQSCSVATLEDEERNLLKSIQHDVRHAIEKYKKQLVRTPSLFVKHQRETSSNKQQPSEQPTTTTTTKLEFVYTKSPEKKAFIVASNKKKNSNNNKTESSKKKSQPLIERKSVSTKTNSRSKSNVSSVSKKSAKQEPPKLVTPVINKGKSRYSISSKENKNPNSQKHMRLSARDNFFSIQEQNEYSSSQKKSNTRGRSLDKRIK